MQLQYNIKRESEIKTNHDIIDTAQLRQDVGEPAEDREIILEFKNISKYYGETEILQDISCRIHEGEFVSIVGPSGCGKTTILRIIKGLLMPDSGKVYYNRRIIRSRRDIGFIFQGSNLLPWRTVMENIRLPLEISRRDSAENQAKIKEFISLTGLAGSEDKYPHQLSGGMKQLAALAKALVDDDKIILMDEPFASLDPATREMMAKKLHAIWKKTNTTIIFVTHFIDEAVFLSDKIIALSSKPGRVLKVARTSDYNGGNYNSYKYSISSKIGELMTSENGSGQGRMKRQNNNTNKSLSNVMKGKLGYIMSFSLLILFILLWKGILNISDYPEFILPSPGVVLSRFFEALSNNDLLMHTGITFFEAVTGFIIGTFIGVSAGYPLSKIPLLEKMLYPYITASQTTPIIAVAPLLALWFGFGLTSKIFISALIVLFPVLLATITSIRTVERDLGDIMRALGASRLQTLLKLELPGSLPYLFSTMKVAITLSLIGAVVGEFVSSNRGLGYLIIAAKGVLDTPLLFVTIFMLAFVGITLYSSVILIEKMLFRSRGYYER
ncbi:MAG: ATP-binding cassette domain-containing protein [candidate division KSB1 bacterium]|nr:ATP-binding cassette domain-containing protein [candidate division KSB1 bacterium]